MDRRKWITTREAAEILGVRPATMRIWRMQGRHPGLTWLKDGGRVFYSRSIVTKFAERGKYRRTVVA